MLSFQYRSIGAALLEEVAGLLRQGQTVVVLGPRNVGKRYLMRRLHDHLLQEPAVELAQVQFLEGAPGDEDMTCEEGCAHGTQDVVRLEPDVPVVLRWLERRPAPSDRAAMLLASNLDALPQPQARQLLLAARDGATGKGGGRLAAVFTGELDLRDLLTGRDVDWPGLQRFVLQGFDRPEFRALAARYLTLLRLRAGEPEETLLDALYDRAGGSPHLLRLMLWTAFDRWAAQGEERGGSLRLADLPGYVATSQLPWNYYFRYVTRLIGQRPGCWGELERLTQGQPVPVRGGEPTDLELAGVAIRDGPRLRLPGAALGEFVRSHYTTRRLADLHAVRGQWVAAFERYRRISPEGRLRPSTLDDVADVGEVVQVLCTSLYGEAAQGAEAVQTQFTCGCRYVLGISEITFWGWDGAWRCEVVSGGDRPAADAAAYQRLLPPLGTARPQLMHGTAEESVLVARLPSARGQPRAVVVGHPLELGLTSLARRQLTRQVTEHFLSAYAQALEVERDRERLRASEGYAAMSGDVLLALSAEVKDVRPLLVQTAARLRHLGYRRVLFCLVDSAGQRVRGVWEDSDDPRRTLQRVTDYSLEGQEEALQKDVVRTGMAKAFRDARREPQANQENVALTGLKGGAIVPLCEPGRLVLGTLLVERAGGAMPTTEELADLEGLGRRLGVALEHTEQMALLFGALDRLPEPLAVFDLRRRLRYANERASRFVTGAVDGWHRAEAAPTLDQLQTRGKGDIIDQFRNQLETSLSPAEGQGARQVGSLKVTDGEEDYHVALYTDRIADRGGEPIGAMCCSLDQSYLYRVFEALRHLNRANDRASFLREAVAATKALRHRQARLYLIADNGRSVTPGQASYGAVPQEGPCSCPGCTTFALTEEGAPGWEGWLCVARKAPVVFCHREGLADRAEVRTDRGLRVLNVQRPTCPRLLALGPDDFWVDFPLLDGGSPVGKVSLDCRSDYHPEDFAFLKVLCEMVSELLGSWCRWERVLDQEVGDHATRTLRDVFHHVGTNLAAFDAVLAGYRRVAAAATGDTAGHLRELNDCLSQAYERLQLLVRGTKDKVLVPAAERHRVDLVAVLRGAFAGSVPPVPWTLNAVDPGTAPPLEMDLDRPRFESALVQLINNARSCHGEPERLRIDVTVVPFLRSGQPWARIAFADNGPGVPPEIRGKLFEPFFSHRPNSTRGTGFGLFFVRRVLQEHGGTIRLDPDYPRGACFLLELPRSRRGLS
jgi:GAF domain-containing protein